VSSGSDMHSVSPDPNCRRGPHLSCRVGRPLDRPRKRADINRPGKSGPLNRAVPRGPSQTSSCSPSLSRLAVLYPEANLRTKDGIASGVPRSTPSARAGDQENSMTHQRTGRSTIRTRPRRACDCAIARASGGLSVVYSATSSLPGTYGSRFRSRNSRRSCTSRATGEPYAAVAMKQPPPPPASEELPLAATPVPSA
jgi:hypothetical protein